jgi:ankyrin repeat protein
MRGSGAGVDLRRAAIEGNVSNAISILECHTDVQNETDETGWTALIAAACNGKIPIVELLLNRESIAIDVQTEYGYSALICAARWSQSNRDSHAIIVRLLLKHGANVDLRTSVSNRNALEMAQYHGNTELAALLEKEACWRRKRGWVMFSSMYKASLLTATQPLGISVVERTLAMDEITRLVARWL